jgi:hydroxymethylglutaryl-CoA reductase
MSSPASVSVWSGYFRLSLADRIQLLQREIPSLTHEDIESLNGAINFTKTDAIIENAIGNVAIPLGIAPNFVLNGQPYVVPMSVEESSVIAAASGAAKLISDNGGFKANSTEPIMIGQIQIVGLTDNERIRAGEVIQEEQERIIEQANEKCQSMVKRGGGCRALRLRYTNNRLRQGIQDSQLSLLVDLLIDCRDCMGANLINTVCEGSAGEILALLKYKGIENARIGLRILSNLCSERRTKAEFILPFTSLSWKGVNGREVAERILEAFHFACDDEYRACTNNKGIMNGIDAVAIATGQDWRAIEAAAHCWAWKRNVQSDGRGVYGPLAQYRIQGENLIGELELPISVGTVGGSIQSLPIFRATHKILGNPNSSQLSQVMVAVGLAQNFAAIRALAVEGIQRGHMALHARNIAAAAGASKKEVIEIIANYCSKLKKINQQAANEFQSEFQRCAPVEPSQLAVLAWNVDGIVKAIAFPSRFPRLFILAGDEDSINCRLLCSSPQPTSTEISLFYQQLINCLNHHRSALLQNLTGSDHERIINFPLSAVDELLQELNKRTDKRE